jgi:hypothetical protein
VTLRARPGGGPLLGLVIAAAGCNAIFGLAPTTLGTDGAAGSDAAPGGFDAPYSAGCQGREGPEPVNIDGMFCIDSTQVTNAQYTKFASSVTPATATQAVGCDGNDTFAPAGGLLNDDYPVVTVDYCDAWAYCHWAGKRLCAQVDPQATGYDPLSASEMYFVCTGAGKDMNLAYAYGDTYDPDKCGDTESQAAPVKSHPDCHSAVYPQVFDLSANVGYWENMCSPGVCRDTTPEGGGSASDSHRCDNSNGDPITLQHPYIGIRCCSDVIHPG